ncbi:MAG: HlyC/CorC family transporter [Bacteroidales bacterium]|nr:HlyC/CorC family transporter [Bacteroidales bacterium]
MNYLSIIIITLCFSAFFSGMEIAFIASNKLRLELNRKQGHFSSRFIAVFLEDPSQYIATMLVGNNIALVIYGISMAAFLDPFIRLFTNSELSILVIQTLLSTLLIIFTAEFLPKTLVRINPNLILNIMALPLVIIYYLLYPVSYFFTRLSNLIIKRIRKSGAEERQSMTVFGKVDLDYLISEGQHHDGDQYLDDKTEIKLFQNALDFSSVKLRDCMVPRTEIVALEVNNTIEELKQRFVETGFSKILIYEDSIDNIIGYVTSKDLFKNPSSIKSKLIPLSYVPETMAANKLLHKFIKERKGMAVVVDEFGGISGMITIEDIMEEIFGEIEDEHDTDEFIEKIISENTYTFSGRLEIDYLNEQYPLSIPESEDYDTLAGFIMFHYESIPKLNEILTIEHFEFKILKVSHTRIELVQMKIITE